MPVSLLPRALTLGAVCLGLLACSFDANAQGKKSSAPPPPPVPTVAPAAAKPTPPPKPSPAQPAAAEPAPSDKAKPAGLWINKRNEQSPLGTNLDGINDWSPEFPFVDAMKRSREWISSTRDTWEDERKFALDEQGWVRSLQKGQLARTLVFWEQTHYPAGDYVVLYEGKGTLSYDVRGKVIERRPGRDVIRVTQPGNFAVLVEALPRADQPIKNIRVIMPGGVCANDPLRYCDAKQPCAEKAVCSSFEQNHEAQLFHPKFLERLSKFKVVRFMDWMKTNESKEVKWKDRPRATDLRYREGAPLEIMVALANRLQQHAWFNIPHAADDDYVRNFAVYVRDNLRPDVKAYVEYSNEVWNGMFPQAGYAQEQGKKLKLGESDWDAQSRFYAHRTLEIHKIWESVFKGQQKRVVRVVAAQAANLGVADGALGYKDMKNHVDALAIAPYFGGEYGSPEELKRWQNASVDDVLADLRKRSLPTLNEWVKAHAELAARYKIDLVAYEGGESFAGIAGTEDDPKLNQLFDAVGRDPRIKDIYLEYLEGWKKNGGKLFVHFTDCFTPGKWGRWGALEWLEQPRKQAPKFDGLMTFIEKNEKWW